MYKKKMGVIFLIFVLFIITYSLFGGVEAFKGYNFNNGGYYILGVQGESDYNQLAAELGDFYSDEISILNQFKKKWIFRKPCAYHACGYHYIVYLCKDGKVLKEYPINLNCNEIVTDKGSFIFNEKQLEIFKGKLKKPFITHKNFSSLKQAREYLNKCFEKKTIIMVDLPEWANFEGIFRFDYEYDDNSTKWDLRDKKIIKILTKEISEAYPNEKFELKTWGSKSGGGKKPTVFIKVTCNKTLYDKFKLYVIKRGWEAFDIRINTYWTEKNDI